MVIGFITYGDTTAKYLPYFLPSLKNQNLENCRLIAIDNSEDENNNNIKYLRDHGIAYERAGGNIGFARGYNKLIQRALNWQADYFLALNPDMIIASGAAEKMMRVLDRYKELGSVSPKIKRWDFINLKKTNIIDSCGITETSALRFSELGQGEEDKGQCDNHEILGPSGAAAMYRISALKNTKEKNNYFDELMFMYKEDCDLAYRLKLAGFKSECVSDAIIYHDRTASAHSSSNLNVAMNRKNKGRLVKEWSFLNKHIIFIKYWRLQNFKQKLEVLWYAFRMFVFVLLFEQYLLGQYVKLWRVRKQIVFYPASSGFLKKQNSRKTR